MAAGHSEKAEAKEAGEEHGREAANTEAGEEEQSDFIKLSPTQIRDAGIEIGAARRGFAGAVEAPGVIVADPQRAASVSSSVTGRVLDVRKNLGETVARGETLAIIDSREVAQFAADATIARRQRELADATFAREERLYAEKVSSRQEYETVRAARDDARTRLRLAEQQVASAGGAKGQMGQLHLRAPIAGVVTARSIALGEVVDADAKLFEVVDLRTLSVELSLAPADASRLSVGSTVDIVADGRTGAAKLTYLSRVLDPATRQVRAIASIANPGTNWRIGEAVRASLPLAAAGGERTLAIPRTAVQTVEDKPSVFVREKDGFSIRHVAVGEAAGAYLTVQSGLDGSERIAVSNTYILKAEHGKGEAGEDHD
ncbi:MAG: efflux RND transporter periplasmic adaptor subunit [Janthinobacterium lividum]